MNEEKSIQDILKEQLAILPKSVVEAILATDYKSKLREITNRQRLLIDQAGKLEMETTLVMIGLEPLADFISNLQKTLELPVTRAEEVAKDVSESIFKPIRDSLYAMNQEMESDLNAVPTEEKLINEAPRSTDSNDSDLNREQILSEIENPSLIKSTLMPASLATKTTGIATSESKEIETLDEVPYQQDIKIKTAAIVPVSSDLETKMAGITITSQQKVRAEPEYKLPETEKKRPSSGVDPYREEIK